MCILTIKGYIIELITDIKDSFNNLWQNIEGFFLKYMSAETYHILLLGLIIIIILFIVLAIMNRD